MTTWFTSDTHFGHKKIIELCKRPFKDVEDMDEMLIARWNAVVQPTDHVYHLGDFAFKNQDLYLPRLHGFKYLLKGNHDPKKIMQYSANWIGVENSYFELKLGEQLIVMCHYALRVWNRSHYGAIHLYGHSHGTLAGDSQCLDVGVDCWDFYPVTLDQIRTRLATLPARIELKGKNVPA